MQNISTLFKDLSEMVLKGQPLEAFEKYYHDEVVMQENNQEPTVGKAANRLRETDFFSKARDFCQNARLLHATFGENLSMAQWHYQYVHEDWGMKNYTQVSVQHWKDGKIIKEQFFYGN